MSDYISSIKSIPAPRHRVYERLSDLNGLASVKEHLPEEAKEKIQIEPIDRDSCAFVIPGCGRLVLHFVVREPVGSIMFATDQSPVVLSLLIELIEPNASDTRLRLTLRAELNFFVQKMIGSKLQDGVEKLAEMLARLPY